MLETDPVLTPNEAVVAPAGTMTEPGTERTVLEFDRSTVAPAPDAAALRVTVQLAAEFADRVVVLQVTERTVTAGMTRLTVVLAELPL